MTIMPLHAGGNRNPRIHLDSIRVEHPESIKGRSFILIDDVTTTGGSLHACSQLLMRAGATDVCCMALARTVRQRSHYCDGLIPF